MLVFILGNLPLPLILYLNWRVTTEMFRVHRLAKHTDTVIEKPRRLKVGWWVSNSAIIFALIPPVSEHRLFVQNPRWLAYYGVSAILTITGLLLMNSALGEELRLLAARQPERHQRKPVDIIASDKL